MRQTDGQSDWHADPATETVIERTILTDGQVCRQAANIDRHTDTDRNRRVGRHRQKQTGRQTHRQPQTGR